MTSAQRFERDLPQILDDIAAGPYPEYINDILLVTTRRRQRWAWTFPERWIPMDFVTPGELAPATRMPWRALALVGLLAALLAATLAVYVGSQRRTPNTFGPAANGLVVYSDHGDIFVRDDFAGAPRLIVGGQDNDLAVSFSRQGTELLFYRAGVGQILSTLWVVAPDGTGGQKLDGEYDGVSGLEWSPAGEAIVVSHRVKDRDVITIAPTDGSSATQLNLPVEATEATWRPPTGEQISFRGKDAGGWAQFVVDRDGSRLQRLTLASERMFETEYDARGARWSDSGRRVLYDGIHQVAAGNQSGLRIHTAEVDDAGLVLSDTRYDFEDTADDELNARWLPGDDRIVYQRRLGNEEVGITDSLRIGFLDGSGRSIDLGITSTAGDGIGYDVSPDGRQLIAIAWTERTTYVTDLTTYESTVAPFASDEGATWQRVAVP